MILRFLRQTMPLLILALSACAGNLISSEEREDLRAAQRTWHARGFTDYSIEVRSGCFCPQEMNEWTRIEVVDDTVRRATILSTGEVITDSRLTMWQSVEDLFRNLITSDHSEAIADITFTLDPTLGFPTRVVWTEKRNVADAGGTREMRNALPLTNLFSQH